MNRKRMDQLREACRDPGFAAFVNNESDPGARRWAAFCLSLADADRLSDDRRQFLYRAMRQERRPALLNRLAGAKVPRELAAILIRLSPTELDARAVRQLARDATTPTTLRALAPLDQLTLQLAAQLGRVPERFRTPGILSVLNRLQLSRDFWRKMEANLARIPADLAGSIVARLQRARSVGAFFDAANAAWEATRRDDPFRVARSNVSDARLVMLDSPSALSAEAQRMENCLADYKFLPLDGDVAYAAWRGSEPATVELVWGGQSIGPRTKVDQVYGRLGPEDLISAESSLLEFVYSADEQPRRLVLEGTNVRGLVTLSDIQKLPVRMSLFSLFIHFELLLTDHLRYLLHSQDPIELLPLSRADHVKTKWKTFVANELEQDKFGAMDICDKREIAKKLKILGRSANSIETSIADIEKNLRNPIAHGGEYAISKEHAFKTISAARAMRDWIMDLRKARGGLQ